MKDLKTLAAECEAELRSLNIQPGEINSWTVNTRAKNRWGQCKRYLPGLFDISISARLLQDNVSDQAAKNTIMHELLHTVKGCYGHKGKWKVLAMTVNRLLPQYTIKRTTSAEEKGLESIRRERTNRYAVKCDHCGKEYYREKVSKLIQHPDKFRCGVCGNSLTRVR